MSDFSGKRMSLLLTPGNSGRSRKLLNLTILFNGEMHCHYSQEG